MISSTTEFFPCFLRNRARAGELAVIGQDQESFRVHVQSSNRQHMTAKLRAAIKNGWSSLGIAGGRQISDGLVEHVEQILVLYGNLFAIDCDFVHAWQNLHAQLTHDITIDGDTALGDQSLALASGCNTTVCHIFLQSNLCHYTPPRYNYTPKS